jgi:hypothetical protein
MANATIAALRNGDIGLNEASFPYPLRKYTGKDTLMGKIIFLWETFKLFPKGKWLTVFTIGATRVLYKLH